MKRILKQGLTLLLCLSLLQGVCAPAGATQESGESLFTDVPTTHWAAASIHRAVELGLFRGETETFFGVGHPMTRAALAVVLCRMFQWEPLYPEQSTYEDVQDPSVWYYGSVEAAYAHGAITRQTGTFRPTDPITREELAVMLVRALGYSALAGLAQDLEMPFTDVTTNRGYLSMAYQLGIVSGTSADTFSPERPATREQAAVMLVRLYEAYTAAAPQQLAILLPEETVPDLGSYHAIAVSGRSLKGQEFVELREETVAQMDALRMAAQTQGIPALLHVTGSGTMLNRDAKDLATTLCRVVQEGSFDGLMLVLEDMKPRQRDALKELLEEVDLILGEGLLYLEVDAPAWGEGLGKTYDYASLSQLADRLVLRLPARKAQTESITVAPVAAMEDLYYALAELRGVVPADKLSVLLPTTADLWKGSRRSETMTAELLEHVLAKGSTTAYYSDRYGCAYLMSKELGADAVVWYLDETAGAQRVQMARLFGIPELCLSNGTSVYEGLRAGLQG